MSGRYRRSVGSGLLQTTHQYPDRNVTLHFFRCDLVGEPSPQLGQDLRWVPAAELDTLDFPPADADLIAALKKTSSG